MQLFTGVPSLEVFCFCFSFFLQVELFDTILLCTFTVCFLNMRRIEDMAFFLPPQRLVYYVCISSAQFSIWSLSSVFALRLFQGSVIM